MREGTLKQLNVKEGDKVRSLHSSSVYEIRRYSDGTLRCYCLKSKNLGADWWGLAVEDSYALYELLEEEAMEIKVGDEVEVCYTQDGGWWNDGHIVSAIVGDYYILTVGKVAPVVAHKSTVSKPKPKPVVKEVSFYGKVSEYQEEGFNPFPMGWYKDTRDTHKITFNLVDGEPDCNSIKMIKL